MKLSDNSFKIYVLIVLIFCSVSILLPFANAEVKRLKFQDTQGTYLIVEALDDDLIHVEISRAGNGPSVSQPLYTSPMVFKRDYSGPSFFSESGSEIETSDIRINVHTSNLCLNIRDKTKSDALLTTLCPDDFEIPFKGLNINPAAIQHIYGLGQEFKMLGSADGDWITFGIREGAGGLGNGFQAFQNGAVGNVQIPVMYAVGNNVNYALLLDNVYKQKWDFSVFWWKVRMYGDQIRFYIMTGPDLPDLRTDYMELTGRPPVPPRKSFGLWVSEFGYDNFDQIDKLLAGLRSDNFPVDGFVLDMNWFGGIDQHNASNSRMGRLNWDEDNSDGNGYFFQNQDQKIQQYAADHIGLTTIEESYIADTLHVDTFQQMPPDLTAYQRTGNICDENNQAVAVTDVQGFWGKGRMIDWSDPDAGKWIHENRRFPNLVQKGITAHWTDLGEPETFSGTACYEGVETAVSNPKNEHSDIHNLYNLLWIRSIWDGYFDKQGQPNNTGLVNPRPFILTRSGTAGVQRYGSAMWSGDIAANLQSLSSHMNAHMHMSFSGIDYYGSDVGGFRREVLPYNNKNGDYRGYDEENYTQWLANSAWFDVPLRPHTDNEFIQANPRYATAPHLTGKKKSNLANIRQRYELIPYYYSLAYRAHLLGEPVISPLSMYYQDDTNVRKMGHEKLIGKDLLVGVVSSYGEYERDIYLPSGRWANYHTNEFVISTGQWIEDIPVYRNGILRLPAFARAGAIFPQMYVDENTKDVFGTRKNNAPPHNELIVKVVADATASTFTLYEDDGKTLGYQSDGRPLYHYRTTQISQQKTNDSVTINILPAVNVNGNTPFKGAVNKRQNVVKVVDEEVEATTVTLNGNSLTRHFSQSELDDAESGWLNTGNNMILAKSESMNVYNTTKIFVFSLQTVTPAASVNFVCDKGRTDPGESIYVAGGIPELGAWDTDHALKLKPNVNYEYIWNPPQGHNGPGPSDPIWTGVISGMPVNATFEWKCVRKREDGTGEVQWEPGDNNIHTTTSSGYAGRSYGSF